jgi:hypothetical protein
MARGVLCAQVAVEAISEEDICFEHHILLDDGDLLGAAKRFGAVMERLLIMARSGRAMTHPNHDTVTTARKR